MTAQRPVSFRSAIALCAVLLLCAPAYAADVAAPGPCAVASDRDPCAGGACTKNGSTTRNRFSPEEVASESALDGEAASRPDFNPFTGPGPCADPSAGCGGPRVVTTAVSSVVPTPRAPAPDAIPGPPAAPTTPGAPNPPIPAPPVASGPPVVAATPPPPPAPPAPPAAPLPPSPPPPTPPNPPPVVVEPPPGPVLPPGVPVP